MRFSNRSFHAPFAPPPAVPFARHAEERNMRSTIESAFDQGGLEWGAAKAKATPALQTHGTLVRGSLWVSPSGSPPFSRKSRSQLLPESRFRDSGT